MKHESDQLHNEQAQFEKLLNGMGLDYGWDYTEHIHRMFMGYMTSDLVEVDDNPQREGITKAYQNMLQLMGYLQKLKAQRN